MTAYSAEKGFQRSIHSIENSPFRTKFESDVEGMSGNLCIGSISDTDPQPILLKSRLGTYAVCNIGIINNDEELCSELLSKSSASFETMSSGKVNSSSLIGALIAQKDNIVDGIRYAQEKIQGTMSLLILTEDGIIAARDKDGRLPIIIGRRDDGYCVSFESFAFQKLGYDIYREMLPGEIVKITSKRAEVLSEGCQKNLRICTFLWTYYGYPNSVYEGVTVETMRTRNGEDHGGARYPERHTGLTWISSAASRFRRSPRDRLTQTAAVSRSHVLSLKYTPPGRAAHAAEPEP